MYLCKKTLEKLRNIINGDNTDDYKSGPMLVAFFNEPGLNNFYGKGFPSRWWSSWIRILRTGFAILRVVLQDFWLPAETILEKEIRRKFFLIIRTEIIL